MPKAGMVVPQPAAITSPWRARVFSAKPSRPASATASGTIRTTRPEAEGMMKLSRMPAPANPAAMAM